MPLPAVMAPSTIIVVPVRKPTSAPSAATSRQVCRPIARGNYIGAG